MKTLEKSGLKRTGVLGLAVALASVLAVGCGDDAGGSSEIKDCDGKCTEDQVCNTETNQCEPKLEEGLTCLKDQVVCGDVCADLTKDPAHCGDCDIACLSGQECVESVCQYVCTSAEETVCSDGCQNLSNDVNNCGECGKKCETDEVCVEGDCGMACNTGETACGETCANLLFDAANCGKCGNACDVEAGEVCKEGTCEKTCPAGFEKCGDECLDLYSNESCGTCESHKACNVENSEVCTDGVCKVVCTKENQILCNNACVDIQSDKGNCGGCGSEFACAADEVCKLGKCVGDCGELVDCNGNCIDPSNSPDYCGASVLCEAYKVCGEGLSCQSGQCLCTDDTQTMCLVGEGEYICTDPLSDVKFCGCSAEGAGVDCSAVGGIASSTCEEGVCKLTCDENHADCDGDPSNGCEVDLTSVDNCGECGFACKDENASSIQCVASHCQFVCKENMATCDGSCIDISSDNKNCGWCGNTCSGGSTCQNGFCTLPSDGCDTDGYMTLKVDETEVKAYCIRTETMFRDMRDMINQGKVYPDAKNAQNAYVIVDDLIFGNEPSWKPVGTVSNPFKNGYFFGNGRLIDASLTTTGNDVGLFGVIKDAYVSDMNLKVNLTAKGTNITHVGALAGTVDNSKILHCVAHDATVQAPENLDYSNTEEVGGLIGRVINTSYVNHSSVYALKVPLNGGGESGGMFGTVNGGSVIDNCTADVEVTMTRDRYTDAVGVMIGWLNGATVKNSNAKGTIKLDNIKSSIRGIGGLVGVTHYDAVIDNCYADVDINAPSAYGVGGLVGGWNNQAKRTGVIQTSYAAGDVICNNLCGGLLGQGEGYDVTNCHATGNVEAINNYAGGLIGALSHVGNVSNSYATGNVTSKLSYVGGLIGNVNGGTVKSSYATGAVKGAAFVGGLIGNVTNVTVEDVYATGDVTSSVHVAACQGGANTCTGGAFGQVEAASKITNAYAKGNVQGGGYVGGLIGRLSGSTVTNTAAFGSATCLTVNEVTGIRAGGLVGCAVDGWTVTNSVAMGDVVGSDEVGAVIGGVHRATNMLRNVYGTGLVKGTNPGGIVGYFVNQGSFRISNAYHWEENKVNAVAVGAPAETSAYPFKYNDKKEAVSAVNVNRKLTDALGADWISVNCTLATGPKEAVTLSIPKALGAEICE